MRFIEHPEAPASIARALREQPHPGDPGRAWDEFDKSEVRAELWLLQNGLCAYCERVLEFAPGHSSIDHVIPKSSDGSVTFCYSNLVLCCTDPRTCNLHKKGKFFAGTDQTGRWREGFVAPTQRRCEASFDYRLDGSVAPFPTSYAADTRETIRILNLNHTELRTKRREVLQTIDLAIAAIAEQPEALREFREAELTPTNLKPFPSAKKQHFAL